MSGTSKRGVALLFDLDGTLVDSVYEHVSTWHAALEKVGIELPGYWIHRRIGMNGPMISRAALREVGRPMDESLVEQMVKLHGERFEQFAAEVKPLPGARELIHGLHDRKVPLAIATSGKRKGVEPLLKAIELPKDVPVISGDDVERPKPHPDPYLAAAERLGVSMSDCIVIGDSIWDLLAAQRARALGVGLLTGGYGRDELERAGAYRVYEDPADLARHLEDVGLIESR